MQKRAPWLAVPIGTVDCLIRIFEASREPWPRAAAALDLARHLDLASSGRAHTFPSRRTLAARWGWTEASVRGLLVSRHEWSDPTKEADEPAIRPTLAQRSPKGRPAETVAPAQSAAVSPNARPELTQRSPSIRPDVLPDSLENVAFEYGLSEIGTDVAITTHLHNHNHKNTYEPARDDEPPGESDPTMHSLLYERVIPGIITGSRPTMDTAAADNDGEDTSPPVALAPSPLLDSERPATSETSAPDKPDSGSLLTSSGASPAKPKRKAKTAPDETQIAAIAADVERAIGSIGRCKPGSMRWKQLANAVKGAGVERMAARIAAFADAVQGLPSPAAQTHRAMASKGCDVDNLLWAENGWTLSIDKAIEDAAISRSEAVAASGGMLTHPSAQNAPERQAAPKQTGSAAWDDMLTTIRGTGGLRLSVGLKGSTLSHDAGEHKRRCQAVADIGGWAKLCEMGEHNRGIIRAQFVAAYDRAGVSA
jgi:hypothetical protein